MRCESDELEVDSIAGVVVDTTLVGVAMMLLIVVLNLRTTPWYA